MFNTGYFLLQNIKSESETKINGNRILIKKFNLLKYSYNFYISKRMCYFSLLFYLF